MIDLGFTSGDATPCNFWHEAKELRVTVHGDDFTIVSPTDSLQWLKSSMEKICDIKSDFLGPQEEGCKTELRILNHVIRWTSEGIEYEPDQRHADLIIEQTGVANCSSKAQRPQSFVVSQQ